ncbi:hypothetical protein ANANG_G00114740 [Anguilla anguilla]|uniref:Uncharacterized protein n=1 Tax=Anguilla anguilla TaxID=7936 RepID=A0A9D3RYU2_ANGAN|nr:hypothetical protein ANANG_G00114740 [Anguilla anguilla]
MNEAEVKALVERALEMDRLVHEQYLGLPWERPSTAFMERSGPVEEAAAARPDGVSVAAVKRILELLCDEAGFLIDSKVVKLLAPLDKDEKNLMKLDIILSSIGIEREEDMYKLAEFFKKYGQQRKNRETTPEEEAELEAEGAMAEGSQQGESASSGHTWELIHPNDVLGALRAFTAEHCKPSPGGGETTASPGESSLDLYAGGRDVLETKQQSKILSLDDRDESEDGMFWESAANIIPEAKLKLWDTLETGWMDSTRMDG